jgi:hypothetical protein
MHDPFAFIAIVLSGFLAFVAAYPSALGWLADLLI